MPRTSRGCGAPNQSYSGDPPGRLAMIVASSGVKRRWMAGYLGSSTWSRGFKSAPLSSIPSISRGHANNQSGTYERRMGLCPGRRLGIDAGAGRGDSRRRPERAAADSLDVYGAITRRVISPSLVVKSQQRSATPPGKLPVRRPRTSRRFGASAVVSSISVAYS